MIKRRPLPVSWRILASRHPSAFLLAAQLLSLVLYATLEGNTAARALLAAVGILILTLVVWVITRSPALNWIAWLLVVPAVALSLLSIFYLDSRLVIWSSLLEATLYFYAAGSMVAYMMEDTRVTTDELFAAGATYTLLAWGFAFAYLALQTWAPGSFSGVAFPNEPRTFLELLFLSFTNLSATGLSDILPVSSLARILVMLEQFSGIGYIAVVVSQLIGMTINQRQDRPRP